MTKTNPMYRLAALMLALVLALSPITTAAEAVNYAIDGLQQEETLTELQHIEARFEELYARREAVVQRIDELTQRYEYLLGVFVYCEDAPVITYPGDETGNENEPVGTYPGDENDTGNDNDPGGDDCHYGLDHEAYPNVPESSNEEPYEQYPAEEYPYEEYTPGLLASAFNAAVQLFTPMTVSAAYTPCPCTARAAELAYVYAQLEAYIAELAELDALIEEYEAKLAAIFEQIEALGGYQPIQPFLTSLLPCGAGAWWTVNAPPHNYIPFPFHNEVDWQPLSPLQELRWPVIPGFSVGKIDGRGDLWGRPGTPVGVVFHHTPQLNISACGRFYEANMVAVFWEQVPPHMVAHATHVQLGLQNLHLNFDNGAFPYSYSPTNLPPPTTFDTNAVVGEYFQSDFEWDAEIVNETRAADGNPYAFNLDIAPLRLVLPEGGAFEFVGPNPYIYETDRIYGAWQAGHFPQRPNDPYQHIRNIQIRPKEGLPAGTHQAYVYVYQWGDIPLFCTRRGGYFYDVWLGFVPEFGTGRTFTNANNGRFSVTFVVNPAPITIEKSAEYETRYHTNDPSIAGVLVHDYITYTLRIMNEDPLFPWPAGEVAGDNIDARFAEFVPGSVRIGNTPDPTTVVAYTADRIQPIGGYPFYALRVELPELPSYDDTGLATYITFQVRTRLEAAGNEMYVDADIFGDKWGGAVRTGIPNIAFINIMCRDNEVVVIDTAYSNEVFVPVLAPIPIVVEKWADYNDKRIGHTHPDTTSDPAQVGDVIRYTIHVRNPCLLTVRSGLVLVDRIDLDYVNWIGSHTVTIERFNASGQPAPFFAPFAAASAFAAASPFGGVGTGDMFTEFRATLPELPPGYWVEVSFYVQVRPEAADSQIPNTAFVSRALPDGSNVYSNEWIINVAPEIPPVQLPELEIDKDATPGSVEIGETITYTITVYNSCETLYLPEGDAFVHDYLNLNLVSPPTTVLVNGSPATYTFGMGGTKPHPYSLLRVELPVLAPDESAIITFEVTALAPAASNPIDGGRYGVRNVAYVYDASGNRLDESDPVYVEVTFSEGEFTVVLVEFVNSLPVRNAILNNFDQNDPVTADLTDRPGYQFIGWTIQNCWSTVPAAPATFVPIAANFNYSGLTTGFTMPAANVVVIAHWATPPTPPPPANNIVFNLNGGNIGGNTNNVTNNLTGSAVTTCNVAAQPTRPGGYTFAGWRNPYTGAIYTAGQIAAMPAGQLLTFVAMWNPPPRPDPIVCPSCSEPPTPGSGGTPTPPITTTPNPPIIPTPDPPVIPQQYTVAGPDGPGDEDAVITIPINPGTTPDDIHVDYEPNYWRVESIVIEDGYAFVTLVPLPRPDMYLGDIFSPYHLAYMIGYAEDGTIRPGANITRAEATTIFFRLISDAHRAYIWSQSSPFPDVVLENWYNNAISTMYNGNFVEGYPDGYFRPSQGITRAEFSALIMRLMGYGHVRGNTGSTFTDVPGHWAEGYIHAAYLMGWVQGYGDGTFLPNQFITRAEVAALVNRALRRLPCCLDDLLPGMVTWPDNMDVNAWYYLYIQEATNSHHHVYKANGINEAWTALIVPREWWRLERPDSTPYIFVGEYIGQRIGMVNR